MRNRHGVTPAGNRDGNPVVILATSATQVSAKSGVFYDVESNPGDERRMLTVLESVRCLECGAIYAKPSDGGTVRQNPGCPDCGYVGWMAAAARPFKGAWLQRHSGAGPLPHHSG
jgi:hypothetical protein